MLRQALYSRDEIVKALRFIIGVDDTRPDRLRLFPLMPYGWSRIAVEKYPILFEHSGKMETAFIQYKLERSNNKMKLEISPNNVCFYKSERKN